MSSTLNRPELADSQWLRCAPWIEAALEHSGSTHNLDDVAEKVIGGHAQFWPGEQAALITEIQHDPRSKSLLIWLGGGDLAEIVDRLVPNAEAWGMRQGCARSLIIGRRGWIPTLKPSGYSPVACLLTKEL